MSPIPSATASYGSSGGRVRGSPHRAHDTVDELPPHIKQGRPGAGGGSPAGNEPARRPALTAAVDQVGGQTGGPVGGKPWAGDETVVPVAERLAADASSAVTLSVPPYAVFRIRPAGCTLEATGGFP